MLACPPSAAQKRSSVAVATVQASCKMLAENPAAASHKKAVETGVDAIPTDQCMLMG